MNHLTVQESTSLSEVTETIDLERILRDYSTLCGEILNSKHADLDQESTQNYLLIFDLFKLAINFPENHKKEILIFIDNLKKTYEEYIAFLEKTQELSDNMSGCLSEIDEVYESCNGDGEENYTDFDFSTIRKHAMQSVRLYEDFWEKQGSPFVVKISELKGKTGRYMENFKGGDLAEKSKNFFTIFENIIDKLLEGIDNKYDSLRKMRSDIKDGLTYT